MKMTAMRLAAAAGLLVSASVAAYVAAPRTESGGKIIEIAAQRFEYLPAELTLKKGEPVILELTSKDILMGFNLPDFKLRADMLPGKVTKIRFVPSKAGTFVFYCDIFCGSGHEQMQGVIKVID
jgi:cytochrome c oxidase subunit 2